MTFIPAPNVVSVEIRCTRDNQKVENRLHINVLTAPTPAILASVAAAVKARFVSTWLPLLPTDVILRELYLADQTTQFGPTHTQPGLAGEVGTRAGPPLPNNITLCYSLRTAERGRSRRGRLYWMGFQEGDVTLNNVDATHAENIRVAIGSMRGDIATAGWAWVITSYQENKVARVTAASTIVTSVALVDTVVDSQRRRLPGRGA